ncbi:hypothetical protein QFZ53_002807 [Microbacterium natoriense]|uniref:DUF2510 domain-containing protein n=1 Tax=Microbacterium natoriense TaxID=284570 RepID=A0AAW8EYK5_9MICO|nr:hypothetical protein [Microbacterium natoriense]
MSQESTSPGWYVNKAGQNQWWDGRASPDGIPVMLK